MSTTPLTLPTVEELRAAFPMATHVTNTGSFRVGITDFRITKDNGCFQCYRYAASKCGVGHMTDWRRAIDNAIASAREEYVQQSESDQAAVAALDEALKETKETNT